ncbi:MAG: prephenate dehydrogenase/arogenate dehydrogenase family protein [Alphaproteobacteria bacterium]|nr:prephenate dehydrogenase/arogenate dehydrogenase family protein [Alphaproteobacteria bacterium]
MGTDTLGIIGIGAFGEFILPHLSAHFKTKIYDKLRKPTDLEKIAKKHNAKSVTRLKDLCDSDVILIATPVSTFEPIIKEIKPHLRKGQLVVDVGSVKELPAKILKKNLPAGVDIIGLHPLFGPQSGKNGIKGLNITVCNVRGKRNAKLINFFKKKLGLNVIETTPTEHDKELAYVQGLTHLIGKVFVSLNLAPFKQTTKTYELLKQMVEMVRYDSDELFRTIERDNLYTAHAKRAFFDAVKKLEKKLAKK